MDDREFVLVTCILGVSRDLEVIEPGVACIPDVEECVQHREVRGLSESAGAGEQKDPSVVRIQKLLDQEGFVDIVHATFADALEWLSAEVYPLHRAGWSHGDLLPVQSSSQIPLRFPRIV